MSVLINMDMPKNCHNCELSAKVNLEYGNGYFCQILAEMIANTHERKANCPLVEVPEPHGRLIDADALHNLFEKQWYYDGYGTLYVKDVDGNLKKIFVDVPESSYYGYLTVGKIRKENMK